MKKQLLFVLGAGLLILSFSCKRNELDFDKLSTSVEMEREIAIPLIYGQITVDDLMDTFEDSLMTIQGDTVKIIFGIDSISFVEESDLLFSDTIQIREEAQDEEKAYVIESSALHYTYLNYFPMGVSGYLILYDDISKTTLDTINLNPENGLFIKPAPVDSKGDVIFDDVIEYMDKVILEDETLENLLNIATHVIFSIQLNINDDGSINSVKVPSISTFDFHFGLHAKGSYTSNLNSDN